MLKKKKKEPQRTWSTDMLKEFKEFLLYSPFRRLDFVIKERDDWITYTNMSEERHSSFAGGLIRFEDVYFGLSPCDNLAEEYRDYMGYIEILNGTSDEGVPVPMIRGFIKKEISFFESVTKMAVEYGILDPKKLMVLDIHIDASGVKEDIPTENILNMKLPIKSIEISRRVSFV